MKGNDMKQYGILVDGNVNYKKMPIILETDIMIDGINHKSGSFLYTDNDAVMLSLGYKKIVRSLPTIQDGYSYTTRWEETESEIVQVWDQYEIQDEPADMEAALREIGIEPVEE